MSDASPTPGARPSRIAVLEAGAWGTALARLLGRNGHRVVLWARAPEHAAALQAERDLVGVEASGAVKNVIALAAGMSDALGLGDDTKAALVTRGLVELVRIGTHLGGQPRTGRVGSRC